MIRGETMGQEYCVCCGNPIPEGRQVCLNCEHQLYDSNSIKHKSQEEKIKK